VNLTALRENFGDTVIIIGVTALINALLFVMIPLLAETKRAQHDYGDPIAAVTMQKPQHFEQEEEDPEKEVKDEELSKLPEAATMPDEQSPPPKPEMNIETPDFELNADLEAGQGMGVAMPNPVQDLGNMVFNLSDLDRKPQLINRIQPVYPYEARRKEINGRVILRFIVDREGNVRNVKVVRAQPAGLFDENAKKAVQKWRFKPGYFSGEPVNTRVTVPIKFDLN